MNGLVIDCFAGGGGASEGIEQALGRPVDIAVNHDPLAIAMHKANHPRTHHVTEDIFAADLKGLVAGRRVSLMWASPDCTSHSRAKGGKPRESGLRILPWAVLKHAADLKPDVIIMENVAEIQKWGPLGEDGRPVKEREGEEYAAFVEAMRALGYTFEHRELAACDFGAPTSRKRWYAILRRDGLPTVWPERTHGRRGSPEVEAGALEPYRQAAEVIDWGLPCPSVFASKEEVRRRHSLAAKRPLADATMRRIARGLDRYVISCDEPFLVQIGYGERAGQAPRIDDVREPLGTVVASGSKRYLCQAAYLPINNGSAVETHPLDPVATVTTGRQKLLASAYLTEYYGNAADGLSAAEPLRTVTTRDREGVTAVHLTKFYGGVVGQGLDEPVHTVTAGRGGHFGVAAAHLSKFYGTCTGQSAGVPMHSVTAGGGHLGVVVCRASAWCGAGRLGRWQEVRGMLNRWCGYSLADDEVLLLSIGGASFAIVDVGLRMLTPRELMLAQGFPATYVIDRYADGGKVKKEQQVRMVGNSVVPAMAKALVEANVPRSAQVMEEVA